MLRSAAVSRIQQGLGFRTDLETQIISALQEHQTFLEQGKTLPWFLLQEDQSLSITSGSQDVALPTDFLRVSEDTGIYYTDSDNERVDLVNRPEKEARQYYEDYDAGGPLAYVVRKDTIRVYPVPDDDYTLTWSYFKRADLLSTNIENAWLANAPYLLIAGAGILLATDLRDSAAVQTFTAMYQTAQTNLNNEVAARELQDRPIALGRNN